MPTGTDEDYTRSIVGVEDLKSRLISNCTVGGSPSQQRHLANKQSSQNAKQTDAWLLRQQLQDACHDLIVSNFGSGAELAVTKRVEQDLWNYAFRQQITLLESQLEQQTGSSTLQLAGTRTTLQYFLELATGFYLQLMEEISVISSLDVYPLYRDRDHYGALSTASFTPMSSSPHSTMPRTIATYLVQHCLVHLGDLARYMAKLSPSTGISETTSSSSEPTVDYLEIAQHYYVAAAMLVPFSGQPFNQLAIVEAQQGNRLGAAYLYTRALSARSPFPAAEQNLNRLLERILSSCPLVREKQQQPLAPPKSIAELVTVCIQLVATAWLKPSSSSSFVATTLLSHLGSAAHSFLSDRVGSTFSWFQLVQLTFLTAFVVSRRHHSPQGEVALNFAVLFLNHLVRELTAIAKSDGSGGLNFGRSPLLPATRLLLSFLAVNANSLLVSRDELTVVDENSVSDIRSAKLWNSVAKLADVASIAAAKSSLPYTCPLPEDVELRGCNIFSEEFSSGLGKQLGDGGTSPSDRTGSADCHIDFECGIYPSYTSTSSGTNSNGAIAYLACARFSETCIRLASAAPSLLVVLSSDPYPRFSSPLPMPSFVSNVATPSQGHISTASQQPILNKPPIMADSSEFASSTKVHTIMPVPLMGNPTSVTNIANIATTTGAIGDRPRNVVFQSIVHTMRARVPPVGSSMQNVPASSSPIPRIPVSLQSTGPSQKLLAGFSGVLQPGSSTVANSSRNYSSGPINSSADDNSDNALRQGSVHRNLPPRLARLAEAEANSRAANSGSYNQSSPRGLPSHISLSSSTSSTSSSASASSGKQQPSVSQVGPSYRPSQLPSSLSANNQREQIFGVKYQDFSDSRNGRGAIETFSMTKSSAGGASTSLSEEYRSSNPNSKLNNNANTVDDGWPMLACLRPQLGDVAHPMRNIQSESSLPISKSRMQFPAMAGSMPSTLNEMGKTTEQVPTARSNSTTSDRITTFSLFGLHTPTSDNSWPWPLSSSAAGSTTAEVSSTTESGGGGNGVGWSPMLSAVSAFAQSKPQPLQSSSSSVQDSLYHSFANADHSHSNVNNSSNSITTTGGNNTTKDVSNSLLFACHGGAGNSSSSFGESGSVAEAGWSNLEPNGISPTRLWSAFGFDLQKNHIRGGDSTGAPPTPPT